MNTIETPITKEKVAALVADAFQDSEYFLPKIALQDQLGLDVEVISLKRDPIEIYSNFLRQINDQKKLVASICRGSLLVAKSVDRWWHIPRRVFRTRADSGCLPTNYRL